MAKLTVICENTSRCIAFDAPRRLSDLLIECGISKEHPCSGRGVCGKCTVDIDGDMSEPDKIELEVGSRLSCRTVLLGDARLVLDAERISVETGEESITKSESESIGIAVDIGTTTLALRAYDLTSGKLIGISSAKNPQTDVSSDVIGRINAALSGKLPILNGLILDALEELIRRACQNSAPKKAVICGNTAMLYLLTGKMPTALAKAPFAADCLFDFTENILGTESYLPPAVSAFVGADLLCAVLKTDIDKGGVTLLCDIGTNGEIALFKNGILYTSSTAAGPAFEGVGITMGSNATNGAIDSVKYENGKLRISVIGNTEAKSICGSGVLDAVAAGLEMDLISESGRMNENLSLTPDVFITPEDVRAVQTAKAAIAAGIEALLAESNTELAEIKRCLIAGAFGKHCSEESLFRIGIIPKELDGRLEFVGNAALDGAAMLLLSDVAQEKIKHLKNISRPVSLGGNPIFNDAYIDNIMF